jgi:pilin isopeptide linkage protein
LQSERSDAHDTSEAKTILGRKTNMKKFKKLLTTLLSAAMVFSMAVLPAQADEQTIGTQTSTAITGVSFDKYYISEKGMSVPDQTFTFTMTPDTSIENSNLTNGEMSIVPGLALGDDNATVTLTFGSQATTTATQTKVDGKYAEKLSGFFSFSNVTWPAKAATYRYIVKETAGTNTGITYDTNEYTVDVVVDNNGTVVYAFCGTVAEDKTMSQETKQPIVFKNTSNTDSLTIKKTVTGDLANKTKQFKFTISIPKIGDNITIDDNVTYTGTFTRATNSEAKGTTSITVTVGTDAEFTLADGESLTFEGLPQGMIYTITEDSESSGNYTTNISGVTTVVVDGKAQTVTDYVENSKVFDASKNGENMPIVDGGNTVTFINALNTTTPTGLVLEYAPYLIVMLIVIVGAVLVLVSKKKRRTER